MSPCISFLMVNLRVVASCGWWLQNAPVCNVRAHKDPAGQLVQIAPSSGPKRQIEVRDMVVVLASGRARYITHNGA